MSNSKVNSFIKSKKIIKGDTMEELNKLIKDNSLRWEVASEIKILFHDFKPYQVLMKYKGQETSL